MEFIIATNNNGKLKEMQRILFKMGHEAISLKQANINIDPEENANTFEGNALIKAKEIALFCQKPTIADDSGLCVDALNGAPGVFSARYCGEHSNDKGNNDKLLLEMANISEKERTARFVSCVCVYLPQTGNYLSVNGECEGEIGFEFAGTNGFGYDPLFIPENVGTGTDDISFVPNAQKRTYAQLEDIEKDAISHRGAAMRKMETLLPKFLSENNIL